ncbi:MAG TPA: molybdenum cofactor guanylyltransferase [Chthonomonadales bacterium]|nr:molybdenum cofactor guanylyltransferase [Chthonomonadales bacterium]
MSELNIRCSGIVLAGGKSSRMGFDKAAAPFGASTLLDHVITLVRQVVDEVVVVAASSESFPSCSARVLADLYPGEGPLGGIITALRQAAPGPHLVVACDMPFVAPALLQYMLAASEDFDAVVPQSAGKLQPLCAVYNRTALNPLCRCFSQGGRSVLAALETLNVRVLPDQVMVDIGVYEGSFVNLNTPEEYARNHMEPHAS